MPHSKNRTPSAHPGFLRELGQNEAYELGIQLLGHRRGIIVSGRYTLPKSLSAPGQLAVLQQIFELAVAQTVLEHPMLQVNLVCEDSKKPFWVQQDKIDLRRHIEWKATAPGRDYDTDVQDTISSWLNAEFTSFKNLPAWKVVVVTDGNVEHGSIEVVYVFNHAVADGISAKIFHQTLHEKLNHLGQNEGQSLETLTDHILSLPSPLANIPKPQELLCEFPMDAKLTAKAGIDLLRPTWLQSKYAPKWAPILQSDCRTQYRILSISHDTLQTILATCRTHKTTLTALLHAVALVAFTTQLKEPNAAFSSYTALDTRRLLPRTPDFNPHKAVANYTSNTEHVFDSKLVAKIRHANAEDSPNTKLDDIAWSVATAVRAEIQKTLDLGRKANRVSLMRLISDWQGFARDSVKQPRHETWGLSTLGTFDDMDAATDGAWGLDRAIFLSGALMAGPVMQITPISVKGKELCVGCSWQEGLLDEDLGTRLCADMESRLKRLGGQS